MVVDVVVVDSDGMVSTAEQLKKLRFCAAVFKEALRLKTPAPRLSFNCTVRGLRAFRGYVS